MKRAVRALSAMLLGSASMLVAAQVDTTDWRIEQNRVARPASPAGEIRVVNPWGEVRVRAGEAEELVVSTVVQRHRDDPRQPEVAIEEVDSGFSIEVRFADDLEVAEHPEWQRRRIDLGLFVPAGATLTIRTEEDAIEVRDLAGHADLASRSGAISFRGRGGVRARSESGSVFAQLQQSGWPSPVEIESRTGEIRAELLEGASARVEIETRGPITSDYSITIERAPGSMAKRALATVGSGGQTLRLSSISGAVQLRAVIVPEGASG